MTLVGFFIFASASLGLLAREGIRYGAVALRQFFFGLFLGSIALFITSQVNHKIWGKYAFYIFAGTLLLTLLVFVPGLGFSHGGATRWLSLGSFTFQPAEVLKIGFVIYCAALMASMKEKIKTLRYGVVPLLLLWALTGIILLLQPDTDTFLVMFLASLAMFIVAGGRWLHVASIGVLCIAGLLVLTMARPYLKDRLLTFINPAADPQGSGYQVQQSLIAIGSGGITGRGFGQSIQKFNFLPEPVGDSIFAVFAEEWGLIGSVLLITLYLFFGFRGMRIASRAPTPFSTLLASGIIVIIISQSFINIASMLALFPLSGTPLLFVSQGGTALLFTLAEVGIVLNISQFQRRIG